jgi:hypothetical protein
LEVLELRVPDKVLRTDAIARPPPDRLTA